VCAPTDQSDMSLLSLERPQPQSPEHGLACVYAHSRDKIDTNLVIVIHGNGDNEVNFLRFVSKLSLPLSAMLSVRGPLPVGMKGQMWYPEIEGFQPSPENRMRTKPLWEAGELVAAQMRLAEKCGWPAHRIFLLGHGHGGVVAVDAARKFGKTAGGVVASGDAVLEEALMSDPVPTKVEKHVQDLQLGDTLNFMQLSIEFVSSQPLEEDENKWSYEVVAVEAAATTAGKAKVKPFRVLFDQQDFGNARARPKVIELFEKVCSKKEGEKKVSKFLWGKKKALSCAVFSAA
jgi:predicted esterase